MADDIFDNIKVQFEQFLSSVSNVLSHEKELHLIQNKLRRHFNTTSSSYLCSTDFRSLLIHLHNLFNENNKSTKFFKLLNSFDEQLKKHSIKLIEHNIKSIKTNISTDEETGITSCKSFESSSLSTTSAETSDQSSDLCSNIFVTLNESPLPIINEEPKINTDSNMELRRTNKITKLERRLSNLSRTIRELEEKDLSLDEMRYSDLYQVESNLKKRAYDIYIRLADLKNQSPSVERILDQPVILTDAEIDHPLINKALEDMVNQTRFLPCFNDVFDVVEKTNDQYELDLSVDARKNIAEKAVKIIGIKVKNRRMADFTDIMNSRLPEDFNIEQNDPALENVELENTLIENEREATIKTQKIFEEFSQIDPDLEPEVNIESSGESTVESDEEQEDVDGDEAELEPDVNVDPPDNKTLQNYDAVDILPPFSPTETVHSEDPVEATVKFSLNDGRFKILSTASIPIKRAARNPFISMMKKTAPEVFTIPDDNTEESQPISIIPRRRQRITTNDFSTLPKRSLPDIESSKSKKRKEITEVVILD